MPIILTPPYELEYNLVYVLPKEWEKNECTGGFLTGLLRKPWDHSSIHASIIGRVGTRPDRLIDMGLCVIQNSPIGLYSAQPESSKATVLYQNSFSIPLGITNYFAGIFIEHQTGTSIERKLYVQMSLIIHDIHGLDIDEYFRNLSFHYVGTIDDDGNYCPL